METTQILERGRWRSSGRPVVFRNRVLIGTQPACPALARRSELHAPAPGDRTAVGPRVAHRTPAGAVNSGSTLGLRPWRSGGWHGEWGGGVYRGGDVLSARADDRRPGPRYESRGRDPASLARGRAIPRPCSIAARSCWPEVSTEPRRRPLWRSWIRARGQCAVWPVAAGARRAQRHTARGRQDSSSSEDARRERAWTSAGVFGVGLRPRPAPPGPFALHGPATRPSGCSTDVCCSWVVRIERATP